MKALFKKDLNLFFGDRKTIITTLVLPLVLVTVFALAFSGLRSDNKKTAQIKSIKIGVVDEDASIASQTILNELSKESILSVSTIDATTAEEALKKGKLMGVLHIKKGFMESYLDNTQALNWRFNYLAGSEFQINMFKSFFDPMMANVGKKYARSEEACANTSDMTLAFTPIGGNKEKVEAYNDPWLIQPIIGIALILMLFNTINVGGHLIDEYNNKTLNRLLISPVKYHSFLISKFLVGFLVCSIQFTVILAFSSFVLGLQLFDLPTVGILVLVCSFACAAFFLFVTSISKTRNQLNGLSISGILFLSAIGGSMMPSFIMPASMQQFSPFSINHWAIESFFDVLWRRVDFYPAVFNNVVVLLAIGVVLIAISTFIFKRRFSNL